MFPSISKHRVLAILALLCSPAMPAHIHVGTLFHFTPGLGACGYTNNDAEIVASVSSMVFHSFPGATDNPNLNPICHHKAIIVAENHTLLAPIVDFFTDGTPGAEHNVGLSPAGFEQFAPLAVGVVRGAEWCVM